jgi:Spy/CpxP family protein refolding chaperone
MDNKKNGFFNRAMLAVFILALASFLLLAFQPVFAEKPTGSAMSNQGAKMQGNDLLQGALKDLNLTKEQKAKINNILAAKKPQLMAIQKSTTMTQEEKINKTKTIRESVIKEIKTILTPAQQKKLGETKAKTGETGKKLGITDEQKQKMMALRDKLKPQIQAIRNDNSITKEQKMAKIKKIVKGEVRKILNPEQFKKWEEMREKQGFRRMNNSPNGAPAPPK